MPNSEGHKEVRTRGPIRHVCFIKHRSAMRRRKELSKQDY